MGLRIYQHLATTPPQCSEPQKAHSMLRIGLVNESTDPVRLPISHTEGNKLHWNMIHAVNTKMKYLV